MGFLGASGRAFVALLGVFFLHDTVLAQLTATELRESDRDLPTVYSPYPNLRDQWSERVEWRTNIGWYTTAIHATLMPDGQVMFIGHPKPSNTDFRAAFLMQPSPPFAVLPDEVTVDLIEQPLDATDLKEPPFSTSDDLFCTGNTLTSDGRMFTAGGNRLILNMETQEHTVLGLSYATIFDVTAGTWDRVPEDMIAIANTGIPGRWYPALTRLPDERIMVTGGYDNVSPLSLPNLTAEAWDPVTGTWEVLSTFAETPLEIFNADYTHPVVLPEPVDGRDILMFGAFGIPLLMSTSGTPDWRVSAARPWSEFGEIPNKGASTALLPIRLEDHEWGYHNGSVLIAGGEHDSSHLRFADVYDPVSDHWRMPRMDTRTRRHHPTLVLLPDARVAMVGGRDEGLEPNETRAVYFDPRDAFSILIGTSTTPEVRGYHNVAVLLPDGRILSGGGEGDPPYEPASEKTNFRYLYPPYMFETRPEITAAPPTLNFGQAFALSSTGKAPAEVVLMACGSMTHSMDFNQRYVQLEVTQTTSAGGTHDMTVVGPPNTTVAPAGYYMLFVIDEGLIPSVGEIVRLQ